MAIIAVVLGVMVFAVPIIGILAAIALPAYQDYTIRVKVSEGLMAAEGAKQAVSEFAVARGAFPSSNAEIDYAGFSSRSVASIDVGADGTVLVTFAGPERVAGKTIALTPSRSGDIIQWDCKSGTVDQRSRPSRCMRL